MLTREEFLREVARRHRPGDHITLIGPTGRGKSVLTGQLVPLLVRHTDVAILAPKGRDPALAGLGHPTRTWPPRRSWWEGVAILGGLKEDRHRERPKIWRVEVPIRKVEDFTRLAALYGRILADALARPEQGRRATVIVLDDSRFLADQMKLSKLIVANMMIGRSKRTTMINNFQAPRWVPRECLDQASHVLIWRNRDSDVGKRLAEISGDIDPKAVEAAIRSLDYHDCLWVDGRTDEVHIVGA